MAVPTPTTETAGGNTTAEVRTSDPAWSVAWDAHVELTTRPPLADRGDAAEIPGQFLDDAVRIDQLLSHVAARALPPDLVAHVVRGRQTLATLLKLRTPFEQWKCEQTRPPVGESGGRNPPDSAPIFHWRFILCCQGRWVSLGTAQGRGIRCAGCVRARGVDHQYAAHCVPGTQFYERLDRVSVTASASECPRSRRRVRQESSVPASTVLRSPNATGRPQGSAHHHHESDHE